MESAKTYSMRVVNFREDNGNPPYVHDGKDLDLLLGKKTFRDYCWPEGTEMLVRMPWGIAVSAELHLPDKSVVYIPVNATGGIFPNSWREIFTDEPIPGAQAETHPSSEGSQGPSIRERAGTA